MESLHRLGTETINITPCERTDLYCSSCPQSLGIGMGRY